MKEWQPGPNPILVIPGAKTIVMLGLTHSILKGDRTMTRFDFTDEQVAIFDSYSHKATLNPQEALDLLQWLSDHTDTLYSLTHRSTDQTQSGEKQLEIHLYQEDMSHLEELKAAIPDLQEQRPVVKVLEANWAAVSERALQLLKDYQIEYLVHPLLEDHDAYAQG